MVVAACRVVVEVEAPNWIRRGSAFLFLLLLLLLLPHEFISRSQLQFFPSSLSSLLPHSYFEIIPKLMTSQTPSRGITPTIDQSITPISISLILRFARARFQDEAWKQGMIFFPFPCFFPVNLVSVSKLLARPIPTHHIAALLHADFNSSSPLDNISFFEKRKKEKKWPTIFSSQSEY